MKQKITNLPAEYMALSFFMGGNLEDYFLIRDYANTILIADDDRTKTVIIVLKYVSFMQRV